MIRNARFLSQSRLYHSSRATYLCSIYLHVYRIVRSHSRAREQWHYLSRNDLYAWNVHVRIFFLHAGRICAKVSARVRLHGCVQHRRVSIYLIQKRIWDIRGACVDSVSVCVCVRACVCTHIDFYLTYLPWHINYEATFISLNCKLHCNLRRDGQSSAHDNFSGMKNRSHTHNREEGDDMAFCQTMKFCDRYVIIFERANSYLQYKRYGTR